MPITCSQLSFAFPDGTTLFDELTFTVPDGRTGLVAANGAGKSTRSSSLPDNANRSAARLLSTDQSVIFRRRCRLTPT